MRDFHRVWLQVTALIVWAAGVGDCAAHAGGHAPERIEIGPAGVVAPMELSGDRPIVELMLEGKGPFRFILDTGAGGTVISKELADELGLTGGGEVQLGSPMGPGTVPGRMVRIDRMEIGAARVTGVPAVAMDMSNVFPDKQAPRGVLSAMMFAGCLVTLDYPGRRLELRPGELPPADGATILDYRAEDGIPAVEISVAGTGIMAHLDSGSPGGFTVPKSMIDKLPLLSKPVEVGKGRAVGAEFVVMGAPLNGAVKLGRYAFDNQEVRFADAPMGNIGFKILHRFAITLDASHHRVRLQEAEGTPIVTAGGAAPPRRYGLRLIPGDDGSLRVDGADPGSPAEKAGMRAGDLILGINGTPIGKMDPEQRAVLMRTSPVTLQIERDGKPMDVRMSLD